MRKDFSMEIAYGESKELYIQTCGLSQKASLEIGYLTIEEASILTNEEIQKRSKNIISEASFIELRKIINKRKLIEENYKKNGISDERKIQLSKDMIYNLVSNIFETRQDFEEELSKIKIKKEHINYLIFTQFYNADESSLEIYIENMHELSSRTISTLNKYGIKTLNDLNRITDNNLKNIPGVGTKSIKDIIKFRDEMNLWLAKNIKKELSDKDYLSYFDPLAKYIINLVDSKSGKKGLLYSSGFHPKEVYCVL